MTATENVVVDASALVALLIDGASLGERIADRVGSAHLHAPDHLLVETVNVLRRRRNAGLLTAGQANSAFGSLEELRVRLWPFEVVADRVWQLGPNLSSYDAAYVALAERISASLISLDARIARAPGIRCVVEVID